MTKMHRFKSILGVGLLSSLWGCLAISAEHDSFEDRDGNANQWIVGNVVSGTRGWTLTAPASASIHAGEAGEGAQSFRLSAAASGGISQSSQEVGDVQFRDVMVSLPVAKEIAFGEVPAWGASETQMMVVAFHS